MSGCIFCRIAAGTAPAHRIYDDEMLCAFLDVRPIARGHTLVIPKQHATDLDTLDHDRGARIFTLGHRIAKALRRSDLGADGANLLLNDGAAAFQTVHHVHLHVVPRRRGDLLTVTRGFVLRRSREPEATAAALRAGLDRLDAEERPSHT